MGPWASSAPRRRERVMAWLDRRSWALVFLFLAIGAIEQGFSNTASGLDFGVFVRAAKRFLGGVPLVSPSDGHWTFKYVPAAALVFTPFTILPERLAWAIWNLFSAAALTRVMFLAAVGRRPAPGPASQLIALLFIMPFYAHMFFLGQCDAALLWAAAESEARARRRPGVSGVLLAIAVAFKLPFVLLVTIAVAWREWRRLVWFVASLVAIIALPAARYGAQGNIALLETWRSLLAASTPPLLCSDQNYSVFALACRYVGGERWMTAAFVLGGCALLMVAATALTVLRRDPPLGRDVAFAGIAWLVAFLSPLGWRTNLVNAIPLLYLALGVARGVAKAWRFASITVLSVTLFLFHVLPRLARRSPPWLYDHRHYALVACAVAVVALLGTATAAVREARNATRATAATDAHASAG